VRSLKIFIAVFVIFLFLSSLVFFVWFHIRKSECRFSSPGSNEIKKCGLIYKGPKDENVVFLAKIKKFKLENEEAFVSLDLGVFVQDFRMGKIGIENVYVYESEEDQKKVQNDQYRGEIINASTIDRMNAKYKDEFTTVNIFTSKSADSIIQGLRNLVAKPETSSSRREIINYYLDYWSSCTPKLDNFTRRLEMGNIFAYMIHQTSLWTDKEYVRCIPTVNTLTLLTNN